MHLRGECEGILLSEMLHIKVKSAPNIFYVMVWKVL